MILVYKEITIATFTSGIIDQKNYIPKATYKADLQIWAVQTCEEQDEG